MKTPSLVALILLFAGCDSPIEYVEVPVTDTLYVDVLVADTLYDASFSFFASVYASIEPIYNVPKDSFKVVFRYYLTKIDDRGIDSVWVQGYVFNEDYTELWDISEVYAAPPLAGWVKYAHVERDWPSAALDLKDIYAARVGCSLRYKLSSLSKVIESPIVIFHKVTW